MDVAIIGAAGHVGFGLSLVLADVGHIVRGIDKDETKNRQISSGTVPFLERDAEEYLQRALKSGRLTMTSDLSQVSNSQVIIAVIGTPIDADLNPNMEPLINLANQLGGLIREGQLIILRSTVSPGTTERFAAELATSSGMRPNTDFHVVRGGSGNLNRGISGIAA